MSDSGVDAGEEGSGQVEEKLNPGLVLPHLRCSKCKDFFRGQVFGCTNNHVTCSLCCGVDIESGEDKEEEDEGGMETEDNPDDVVCLMDDCNAKTIIQGSVQLFLLQTQFATRSVLQFTSSTDRC